MFNNYEELFYAYVDFYKTSLYNGPTNSQFQATFDTAPLLKGTSQELFITPLTINQGEIANVHDKTDQRQPSIEMAQSGANNNNVSRQLSALVTAPTSPASVKELGETQTDNLLLSDPRLMAEDNGTRFVRIGAFNGIETSDLVCVGTIFVILFLAKRLLSRKLTGFKRLEQLGMRPKDRERLDESFWRLLYYSFSSTWLIYSCLTHNAHLLLTKRPQSEISYDFQLYWSTYAIYMTEAAFYLHATYALVFEDVWRRDSPMMLVHHLAAIFATLALYTSRMHQIGIISLVLRDSCDVLLEVVKLTKCLHIQHGKRVNSIGTLVNCFLAFFSLIFATNQLYYYPLFCLYHGLNMAKVYSIHTPVMTGMLTCALIFLLLDFLWFGLILRLLYYMALAKPMKDLREFDDEDEDIVESEESEHETNERPSRPKNKKE